MVINRDWLSGGLRVDNNRLHAVTKVYMIRFTSNG